jgi:16S rRNA A1518/A1519 N6-dimethyltransferase RsmA/KsgA/DIM1 with predicted DNA glycosylase/AP lyase activity
MILMIPILPIAPIISMASISPLPAVDFFPPPQLNSGIVPIKSNTNPPILFNRFIVAALGMKGETLFRMTGEALFGMTPGRKSE